MARLLRDTRGSMLLGGSVLSAITVAAAYFLVWIVAILLGL